MAIKELKKSIKSSALDLEKSMEHFIAKGGTLPEDGELHDDHRLTLRIPKALMAKIDTKRKERIGKISRNLWILEALDKATKK
jgi:hypothetical protein